MQRAGLHVQQRGTNRSGLAVCVAATDAETRLVYDVRFSNTLEVAV